MFLENYLLVVSFILFVQHGSSVRVEDYFEQTCNRDVGFTTKNYMDWASKFPSGTPFYYPMLSKLNLLHLTQNLLGGPDLSGVDGTFIDQSCINVFLDKNLTTPFLISQTKKGFCGKTVSKVLKSIDNSPVTFLSTPKFPGGPGGVIRTSLSDNKSWSLIDICGVDGQRAFTVMSSRPRLTPCEQEIIKAHLKAIGFKEEFFYGIDYTNCVNSCFVSPIPKPYYFSH